MAPKRHATCKVCGGERAPGSTMALCLDHLREYNVAANRRSIQNGSVARQPEYRRLRDYMAQARAAGANETEAWWVAMATEIEFEAGRTSPRHVTPFIAAELDWLRANAGTLARLEDRQWRAPAGDSANVQDDGWDELEASA